MNAADRSNLRLLPAVERVLKSSQVVELCARHGRAIVTAWVRDELSELRNVQTNMLPAEAAAVETLVIERIAKHAEQSGTQQLRKVINGTGIVIHTNLGRAPLAAAAIAALTDAAQCTNVEVDISTGLRSRRGTAVEALCRQITGAESALVVNNCAAATLLTLQTAAAGRRALISRGQLIEIGGSFRLPDVFRQAGVELHEVGTTNRTRLADYADAIGPDTAAILRVHPSNYRIAGFCASVGIAELVQLGKQHSLPVIDDVGSGSLYNLAKFGLPDEPIVSESIASGADLVLFSGDKLLGGPQCGIIAGRAEIVERLRKNPLARALRVDKLTLAALQATLEIHRSGRAFEQIPVLQQLALTADEIRPRAEQLLARLPAEKSSPMVFSLAAVESASGGGALPQLTLPSWAIAIASPSADRFAERLRLGQPSIFSRIQQGRTLIDLRTVLACDDEALAERIRQCAQEVENETHS